MGLLLVIADCRGVRQQCDGRAERYCVGLVLFIGGSRGVRQQREGHSETVFCGKGIVYWGKKGGETAARGTERNGIVWDWYWLLGAAWVWDSSEKDRAKRNCVGLVLVIGGSRWVRQQGEGQGGTVLCGTGTGYWGQRGGVREQ